MSTSEAGPKLSTVAVSSVLSLLFLYLLNSNFIFWVVGLVCLFLSLRIIAFHIWIPALAGLAGLLLFGYVDQTLEIYRSLIEDANTLQIALGAYNVFWLSLFVWNSGRLLNRKRVRQLVRQQNSSETELTSDQVSQLKLKLKILWRLPQILGLLPFGGLITGLFIVVLGRNVPGEFSIFSSFRLYEIKCLIVVVAIFVFLNALIFCHTKIQKQLQQWWPFTKNKTKKNISISDGLFNDSDESIVLGIALFWFSALTIPIVKALSGITSAGIAMVLVAILALDVILFYFQKSDTTLSDKERKIVKRNFLISLAVHFLFSVIFLLFVPPLFWSNFLGSISIAALCLSSVTVIFSTIYYWGYSLKKGTHTLFAVMGQRVPAVSILLILAIVSSQFNWNDNHEIRYLKSTQSSEPSQSVGIQESFEKWFNSRTDKDDFKSEGNYPVYIVSAQGGGIYAAYHA
ncbi:MAG: hypothetical protein ACFB0D_11060, partial [Phormidesmis sp.]